MKLKNLVGIVFVFAAISVLCIMICWKLWVSLIIAALWFFANAYLTKYFSDVWFYKNVKLKKDASDNQKSEQTKKHPYLSDLNGDVCSYNSGLENYEPEKLTEELNPIPVLLSFIISTLICGLLLELLYLV